MENDLNNFDDLMLCVNEERPEVTLDILENTMDDEGGFASASQGAEYLKPAIIEALQQTKMNIQSIGKIKLDLSHEVIGQANARYLEPITQCLKTAIDRIRHSVMQGHKVLSLGGNHVRGFDVMGLMKACHEMDVPFGMVWCDAHPDLNTPESTTTGHIHGMPGATIQGQGPKELLDLLEGAPYVDPKNMIYVGINAIDNPKNPDGSEKEHSELKYLQALRAKGVRCFTAPYLNKTKHLKQVPDEVKQAIGELSAKLKAAGGKLAIEWDVDVVDVSDMPAAVMDNHKGLSAEQIYDLFDFIGTYCDVAMMGVSEFAPTKDPDGKGRNLVAKAVGNIFGVSNPVYASHMERSESEMQG